MFAGETITPETPWQIIYLDKFQAHCTDGVKEALLKKHFILLIIPGGLTGDVQVCDTDANKKLKAKSK